MRRVGRITRATDKRDKQARRAPPKRVSGRLARTASQTFRKRTTGQTGVEGIEMSQAARIEQCQSKASEDDASEQQQEPDEQCLEAVIADHRNCHMRIANEQRWNGEEDRQDEGQLRWRRQVHGLSIGYDWCCHGSCSSPYSGSYRTSYHSPRNSTRRGPADGLLSVSAASHRHGKDYPHDDKDCTKRQRHQFHECFPLKAKCVERRLTPGKRPSTSARVEQ